MHDINFFATYKRSQSKDKTFVVFLIILVVVTLLINTGLFVGRSIIFNDIKEEIQLMKDFINNPATRQAIDEANRIQTEAEITAKYLELLLSVDQKLDKLDVIESDLLLRISQLTPESVSFRSAQISGIDVSLTCESSTATGPMDMYHALIDNPYFDNVVMSGITITNTGCSFALNFVIFSEGGEQP